MLTRGRIAEHIAPGVTIDATAESALLIDKANRSRVGVGTDFTFIVAANGKSTAQMSRSEEDATITVDSKKKPKTIDNQHQSGGQKAIANVVFVFERLKGGNNP